MTMIKIAAITEDGKKISAHFGRAPFYQVLTVEDGAVTASEQRQKFHHGDHDHENHAQHQHGNMVAPIADCQVLICGGMGEPAYAKAKAAGLDIFLTGGMITDAVQTYLAGEIQSDQRRLHQHHSHSPQPKVIAADDLFPKKPKN